MTRVKDEHYTVVEITGQTQQEVLDALATHFHTHPDRVLVSLHFETETNPQGKVIEYYVGATIFFSQDILK